MTAPPLPKGRQLGQLIRQLWKEQEAAFLASMRQSGAFAFSQFRLEQWLQPFIERIKPIYARYLVDGRDELQRRLNQRRRGAKSIFSIPSPFNFEQPKEDDQFDIYNPEVVNFINNYSYQFAVSTLQTTRMKLSNAYRRLQQELAQGVEQGQSLQQTTAEVMRIFRDPQRAMTIAASETSRAYHAGQEIAAKQSGVVSGKQWLASSDACEECLALDGKTVALGEPFIVLPKGGPYATVMYPPLHPNCVLGETPVRMSSLISAMHSQYNGPIVRLHFSDSSSISVTPNHMLLSPFGFLRASDFVVGDDVICTGISEQDFVPPLSCPNNNYRPPLAHEVFHSLREAFGVSASSVPVSAEYFHGDATFCNGNIDIVRPDSFLGYTDDATFSQPFDHLPLVLADMFRSVGFPAQGNLASHLNRLLLATDSVVGSSRELLALLRGVSRITKKLGLRASSDTEAKCFQASDNATSANAKGIGHVKDALPGSITTLKVIKVEGILYHRAAVYDFETKESMYIVGNGIVSSNCMCSMTEELNEEWNP